MSQKRLFLFKPATPAGDATAFVFNSIQYFMKVIYILTVLRCRNVLFITDKVINSSRFSRKFNWYSNDVLLFVVLKRKFHSLSWFVLFYLHIDHAGNWELISDFYTQFVWKLQKGSFLRIIVISRNDLGCFWKESSNRLNECRYCKLVSWMLEVIKVWGRLEYSSMY